MKQSKKRLYTIYHTNREFFTAFIDAKSKKKLQFNFCNELFVVQLIMEAIHEEV